MAAEWLATESAAIEVVTAEWLAAEGLAADDADTEQDSTDEAAAEGFASDWVAAEGFAKSAGCTDMKVMAEIAHARSWIFFIFFGFLLFSVISNSVCTNTFSTKIRNFSGSTNLFSITPFFSSLAAFLRRICVFRSIATQGFQS